MTRKRNRLSLALLTDEVLFRAQSSDRAKAYSIVQWLVRSMNTDRLTIRAATLLCRTT